LKEQEAIERLKRGDIGGLETLAQVYQVKAVRTAYLITRDIELAEDIVQDAFVRVHNAIRGFDSTRPFEPWFLRIVVHASVKASQKLARQVQLDDDVEEDAFTRLASQMETVESQVEAVEFQKHIWDAMQRLSPRQRAVIVQRYFLDMSEKEMATELEAAPGTIKWLLNAARERLRALLAERSEK
jgi:RNA polymerase sigma-70 factor (ECF subfamily)